MPTTFWNREYALMCTAGFLATIAVFMPLFLSGSWRVGTGFDEAGVVLCMSFFVLGMFLPGPLSSRWVDAWPRKNVCLVSLCIIGISTYLLLSAVTLTALSALRLIEGAAWGVFQMSLGSTLINDLSISKRRTQADYYFLWFQRLAMPIGVLLAMLLPKYLSPGSVCTVGTLLIALCFLLVFSLRVPFRAPVGAPRISLDRFFAPKAWFLCLPLLLVTAVWGAILYSVPSVRYAAGLFIGLLVAFLTHRVFFETADDRADAVSGMLLIAASVIMLHQMHDVGTLTFACVLCGVGVGWYGSRMLLYFLKLSAHSERGTLQQTYILTATCGFCLGCVLDAYSLMSLSLALAIIVCALLWYLLFAHRRFRRTGDRDFKFREV